jgi:hypothetical protein
MVSGVTRASVSAGGDDGIPRLGRMLDARAPPRTHTESRRHFRPSEEWTQDVTHFG